METGELKMGTDAPGVQFSAKVSTGNFENRNQAPRSSAGIHPANPIF
jgi:hypothetical protein